MPDYDEKTEAPTGKRRTEAREQGNIPKSMDLSSALLLAGALVVIGLVGERLLLGMRVMMVRVLEGDSFGPVGTSANAGGMVSFLGKQVIDLVWPIAVGFFAFALIVNVLQVGFLLTLKPLQPSFSKLSPVKGLQQLFSWKGIMRFLMSMAKTFVVITVATIWIYLHYTDVLGLIHLTAVDGFLKAAEMVYILGWWVVAVLVIIAVADYAFQRWQHERDLKMTKQEVKDEMKQMDGDPQVKRRRMMVARQLAMQRIAAAVPQADVVVTNPTHFAVALQYDQEEMPAPTVVAKGADFMAFRIRDIAEQNDIPVLERKELARALYSDVEVGQQINPEFYNAVAKVLAHVYELNGQASDQARRQEQRQKQRQSA